MKKQSIIHTGLCTLYNTTVTTMHKASNSINLKIQLLETLTQPFSNVESTFWPQTVRFTSLVTLPSYNVIAINDTEAIV